VFSGGADGKVFRWPAVSQPAQPPRGLARIETGLKSTAVSPSCAEFAGIREGSVYLGNVKPDASPARLPALGTNNNCLLFSPQRHFLFAGTWNGVVQVLSLEDHRIQASLRGAAEPVCWLGQDLRGGILVAVHHHLGARFQTPPAPHAVSVWNTANSQPRNSFTIPGLGSEYAVSPDGNFLAAGNYVTGNVQVWNLRDPGQTSILTLPGDVRGVTFSSDGKRLAAATLEGTVRVWEVPAFRLRGEFRAAPGGLFSLAFSPDARRLVTAGARAGSLQVWDVATPEQLVSLESPRAISRAEFSLDGNQLVGVNDEGDVLIWRVPSFEEIEKERTKAQ
jgi:WD40 repeat protein